VDLSSFWFAMTLQMTFATHPRLTTFGGAATVVESSGVFLDDQEA